MGERKRTKKLVNKILNNENKRSLYSDAELIYMQKHVLIDEYLHKAKKLIHKQTKGFGYQS